MERHRYHPAMSNIAQNDENARLIGENILEDPSTRQFWKTDPADVITMEEANAVLNPMLDELLATTVRS